jgi:integrase
MTHPKRTLNDRVLKALKPAPEGETYDVMDTVVPSFGLRVSETGRKTFILVARYPDSKNPTRRKLGLYGALSLAQARDLARDWLELLRRGKDPKEETERRRVEQERSRANSFAAVAERYIKDKVIGADPAHPHQRRGHRVARELRLVASLPMWSGKTISEITRNDVQGVIKDVRDHGLQRGLALHGAAGGRRAMHRRDGFEGARNVLGVLKTFFAWCVSVGEFGIEHSPAAAVSAKGLLGTKRVRDRALDDVELAALWRATERLGYPFRQLYRLLILTGLRLSEVSDAEWREFNLRDRLWIIPAARMKGINGKARAHSVPLTDDMLAILDELPRFKGGEYLFSFNGGRKPPAVKHQIKQKLDARMLRSLKALARMRGDDPARVRLEPWVNHDLRRVVRAGLSKLRVDHFVAESILAHSQPGISRVYNVYDLLDEKREALTLWGQRVREIVSPLPDNVVKLPAERA